MIGNLNITILVDNQSSKAKLHSEHGLPFWVDADDRRFVFDTGQSDLLTGFCGVGGLKICSFSRLV